LLEIEANRTAKTLIGCELHDVSAQANAKFGAKTQAG
jgi:hypothetical protein